MSSLMWHWLTIIAESHKCIARTMRSDRDKEVDHMYAVKSILKFTIFHGCGHRCSIWVDQNLDDHEGKTCVASSILWQVSNFQPTISKRAAGSCVDDKMHILENWYSRCLLTLTSHSIHNRRMRMLCLQASIWKHLGDRFCWSEQNCHVWSYSWDGCIIFIDLTHWYMLIDIRKQNSKNCCVFQQNWCSWRLIEIVDVRFCACISSWKAWQNDFLQPLHLPFGNPRLINEFTILSFFSRTHLETVSSVKLLILIKRLDLSFDLAQISRRQSFTSNSTKPHLLNQTPMNDLLWLNICDSSHDRITWSSSRDPHLDHSICTKSNHTWRCYSTRSDLLDTAFHRSASNVREHFHRQQQDWAIHTSIQSLSLSISEHQTSYSLFDYGK